MSTNTPMTCQNVGLWHLVQKLFHTSWATVFRVKYWNVQIWFILMGRIWRYDLVKKYKFLFSTLWKKICLFFSSVYLVSVFTFIVSCAKASKSLSLMALIMSSILWGTTWSALYSSRGLVFTVVCIPLVLLVDFFSALT